jgi:hypothetical protein
MILEGRQPKAMQLERLTDAISSEWEKQRKAFLQGAQPRGSRAFREEQKWRNPDCGTRQGQASDVARTV